MSKSRDDLATALLIGAGVGLGVGGLIALQKHEQRQAFKRLVADGLRQYGIDVISAEFARGPISEPIWKLTVFHPNIGSVLFPIHLALEADPYSQSTLDYLISEVYHGLARMQQGLFR